MKRFTFKMVGAAAIATLALAGCSGDSNTGGNGGTTSQAPAPSEPAAPDELEGELLFTWWGNDDRANRYEEALELFRADFPGITVETTWQAFPDYWTARATQAAGRTLPDVMQFDSAYLREYGQSGTLLDLKPYIENGTIDLSGFDATLVEAGVLDGKQVAIPTSTNTLAMFSQPDLIEATGIEPLAEGYTWDDYIAMIEAVSAAEVQTDEGQKIYGSGDFTATFWFFLQYQIQQGNQPFTDDGQLNFTQEDIVAWLELSSSLREGGHVFPVERGVQLSPLGGFTKNEVVYETSWDNFLAGYSADSGKDNLQMQPIPSGPNGPAMFFRPSMHLAAGANTEHPEAAAALIDFLLTDPRVGEIFGTSKGVPADAAQRDAVSLEEGSIDAIVMAYEESVADIATAVAPIPVKGFGSIEETWRQLGEELNYGYITPQEFAENWWAEAELAIN